MARPSKLTPTKLAKIDEVIAEGGSTRAAAEAAGVSHQTVAVRQRKRRKRGRPSGADVEAAAAEVEEVLAGPTPSALEDVIQLQGVLRGLIGRLTPLVEDDDYPATSFVTVCKYFESLAGLRAELTPPAPRDPNEDPDVIESERILIARIEKQVVAAEGRGRT